MSHDNDTRLLHVANGTGTTRLIEAAGIPGLRSIWADPLYEGPVPGSLTDAELLDVRRRFLGGDLPIDPVNDMREWRAAIARHHSYDELILWFEHDLFDQLNLIQLLSWIADQLPAIKPVSLIGIGSFHGRADFKGLGQLAPREIASLLDARTAVTSTQFDLARRAWQAFRASTPEALDRLRRDDTSALPYLADAITRFLQEYPGTADGLSRSERHLLRLANGDGIALSHAFRRMQEGEQAYYITDASLAGMADSLSRTSPPLLMFDSSRANGSEVLRGHVALTDAGRSVLAGELDRVRACGIDRWLGGVHLHGRDEVWRWDDSRQRVVSAR